MVVVVGEVMVLKDRLGIAFELHMPGTDCDCRKIYGCWV